MNTPDLDARRFPRVAQYLAGLPNGVASHPECTAKGSIVRSILEDKPIGDIPAGSLPESVRSLAEHFAPYSSWVTEVELMCLNLAFADYHRLSDAAYVERKYQQNRKLFDTFVYKLLMSFTSPVSLIEHAATRWGTLHRGPAMQVELTSQSSARLTLGFPANLYDKLLLDLNAAVFRAALVHGKAQAADVRVADFGSTHAVFDARWS